MQAIQWVRRASLARARRAIRFCAIVSILSVLGAAAVVPPARAQTVGEPEVSGDQLIFIYDARQNRNAFMSVTNSSDDPMFVDVAFYSASITLLARETIELSSGSNRVIDATSFAGGAANGNAGLAVMTPVLAAGDLQPVVPAAPLTGVFTLANLQLLSGIGENPFGRFAVDGSGDPAEPGSAVDGTSISYERFAPSVLMVPTYFDPATLGPPENDGNRILLAAFEDQYGAPFDLGALADDALASFFDNQGGLLTTASVQINGVLLTDLQSVAGSVDLNGASGKVFFDVEPGSGNVFGLFGQSVGTFAAGQRMPEVAFVPAGTVVPPTPTPNGSPTPAPTSTGTAGQCTATIRLEFDANSIPNVAGVQLDLAYPSTLSIPGIASEPPVLARVSDLTGLSGGLFSAFDDEDEPGNLFVTIGLVSPTQPVQPGDFAAVRFDCSSAPAPGSVQCRLTEVSELLGTVVTDQVSCVVSLS